MNKKIRNSNVEMVRIMLMLMIISGHFIGQTGSIKFDGEVSDFILVILGSGSRIATNIFVVISAWYMIGRRVSGTQVFELYLKLLFYSVVFSLVSFAFGNRSIYGLLKGFFPFSFHSLWFVSAYIILMISTPFLNRILLWQGKKVLATVLIFFLTISYMSTIPENEMSFVGDCVWFWCVYLFVGYIKNNNIMDIISNKKLYRIIGLIIGIIIYFMLCIFYYYGIVGRGNTLWINISKISYKYLVDIKSIPNFVCSLCVILYVFTKKEKHFSFVNSVARNTLDVYIIHQVPLFYPVLWNFIKNRIMCCEEVEYLNVVIVSILVFFGGVGFSYLSWWPFIRSLRKTKIYKLISYKADYIFNEIT